MASKWPVSLPSYLNSLNQTKRTFLGIQKLAILARMKGEQRCWLGGGGGNRLNHQAIANSS